MLFVSARIPTSFTCTSIYKTSGQRKFCFNGRPETSGRLYFSLQVRILRVLCASVVNMIFPCPPSPSASSPPRGRVFHHRGAKNTA